MSVIPDRIHDILFKYGETLTTQSATLESISNDITVSDNENEFSPKELLEHKDSEIEKLKGLISELNKSLIDTRRKLEYELETSVGNESYFDSDATLVQENVKVITHGLISAYKKFGTSALMQYNTKSFFLDLPTNEDRYSIATGLCNMAETVSIDVLSLWSDISENNGQLGVE